MIQNDLGLCCEAGGITWRQEIANDQTDGSHGRWPWALHDVLMQS